MKEMTLEKIGCALQRLDDQQWRMTRQLTQGELRDITVYPFKKRYWEQELQSLLEELMVVVRRRGWERLVIECLEKPHRPVSRMHNNKRKRLGDHRACASSLSQRFAKKRKQAIRAMAGGAQS